MLKKHGNSRGRVPSRVDSTGAQRPMDAQLQARCYKEEDARWHACARAAASKDARFKDFSTWVRAGLNSFAGEQPEGAPMPLDADFKETVEWLLQRYNLRHEDMPALTRMAFMILAKLEKADMNPVALAAKATVPSRR